MAARSEVVQADRRKAQPQSLDFVQTDWLYPALAQRFGWKLQDVQLDPLEDFLADLEDELEEIHGPRPDGKPHHEQDDALPAEPCQHNGTDGTVACPNCGLSASAFISSAADFLSENDGKVITWNQ